MHSEHQGLYNCQTMPHRFTKGFVLTFQNTLSSLVVVQWVSKEAMMQSISISVRYGKSLTTQISLSSDTSFSAEASILIYGQNLKPWHNQGPKLSFSDTTATFVCIFMHLLFFKHTFCLHNFRKQNISEIFVYSALPLRHRGMQLTCSLSLNTHQKIQASQQY